MDKRIEGSQLVGHREHLRLEVVNRFGGFGLTDGLVDLLAQSGIKSPKCCHELGRSSTPTDVLRLSTQADVIVDYLG